MAENSRFRGRTVHSDIERRAYDGRTPYPAERAVDSETYGGEIGIIARPDSAQPALRFRNDGNPAGKNRTLYNEPNRPQVNASASQVLREYFQREDAIEDNAADNII